MFRTCHTPANTFALCPPPHAAGRKAKDLRSWRTVYGYWNQVRVGWGGGGWVLGGTRWLNWH
jgi:hypothetical protein